MSEQPKVIERRLLDEVYSQGNLEVIDELVASDFVGHGAAADGGDQGRQAYRQFVIEMRTAFPGFKMTVEDQVAEGDKVVTRFRARGTHAGPFQGIPPTRKQSEISSTIIDRIVDGKIIECWSSAEYLGLLQQLGAIPSSERALRPSIGRSAALMSAYMQRRFASAPATRNQSIAEERSIS